MKILITGSGGQLGQSLQKVAPSYPDWEIDYYTQSDLDITNEEQVFSILEGGSYDYCINCAAYTAVDKAEEEVEKAYAVNAEGPRFLAQACDLYDVCLIHISTDFVFDGLQFDPISETARTNPINVYGASKLKGEQAVINTTPNYFIIRTSWVYSEYGNNFLKTMLRLSKERSSVNVVSDQMGSPTYAPDLAEFIFLIIVKGSVDYGVYHYSNSGIISWHRFAQSIFDLTGSKIELVPIQSKEFSSKALRPKNSALDLSKTRNTFGDILVPWQDSLHKCLVNLNVIPPNGI